MILSLSVITSLFIDRYSTSVLLQTSTCTTAAPTPGCTAVQTVRLDFGAGMIRSPHLVTDPNGLPVFVWQESTFNSVRMLRCASSTCAGVSPAGSIVVDLGGESDGFNHFAHASLDAVAFSAAGRPLLLCVVMHSNMIALCCLLPCHGLLYLVATVCSQESTPVVHVWLVEYVRLTASRWTWACAHLTCPMTP